MTTDRQGNWTGARAIAAPLARVKLEPKEAIMIYHNHPFYDRAIKEGIKLASFNSIARVWYDPSNDKLGASAEGDENFSDYETVAICQRWDKTTIQVRESGAMSNFVKV